MESKGNQLTRRGLLAALAATAASPVMGNAPTRSPIPPMRPERVMPVPALVPGGSLAALIERAGLSGETAAVAIDAETGALIEGHRAELRMPPASVAKAITAMYAYQTLGAERSYVTRLESSGSLRDGVLAGDLVLRGSGDPTLQTADLARLADALVARGLRRVSGRFVVDESSQVRIGQIDPGQPTAAGYNPAVSGLNLNFNRVHFGWEMRNGQAALTLDARSDREAPAVSVIRISAVARNLPVYTHAVETGREVWTVAASALGSPGSRWLPVRLPGAYAGDVFRALMAARGVTLPATEIGRTDPDAILAEQRSATMTAILRDMLRHSTNITAEAVGLTASAQLGRRAIALEPSAARMNDWVGARYGATGMALVDHSGLGPGSRVAPLVMARYLLSARREGVLPGLLRGFALRDANGRENPAHPVSVQAKTGTLNFVSTLAGYAQMRGGRAVVFAIFSADLGRRSRISESDGERPSGARPWAGAARALQQALIERWSRGAA